MDGIQIIVAVVGSFLAGIINTLAGNGSTITLTFLTEMMNLPGNLANGTNRVGIFFQSAASSFAFFKGDKLHIRQHAAYIVTIIIGAIFGVLLAVNVSNEQFKAVFKYAMLLALLIILIKPDKWLQETDLTHRPPNWLVLPVLFLLGVYGGFIQLGMGVIFLVITVLIAKFSIIDANAMKAFVITIYTGLVLIIFHWKGLVDWKIGIILSVGQTLGGYLTARFASHYPNANIVAHRVLIVVVVVATLKLFGIFDMLWNIVD
jgi:uncharacterized membrane protein YfcA